VTTTAGPRGDAIPDTTPRADGSVPIKLMHDRVLVRQDGGEGERTSSGGILIPATAQVGKRLSWARVVAVGPNVRTIEVGDRALYEPEDRGTVELQGVPYVLLRERDVHAVAAVRHGSGGTGLYL
jgi:chaperonin GroES